MVTTERRACSVLCQQRSNQRRQVRTSAFEAELCSRIQALSVTHPRYCYRRIHVWLLRDRFKVNGQSRAAAVAG